jgi:hypothetical protein
MRDDTSTHFVNVDMEVWSSVDLAPLAKAFEPGAYHISRMALDDGFFTNLELADQPEEPEDGIRRFIDLVERLPPKMRAVWDAASKRDFSIGVVAGRDPSQLELPIGPEVLEGAARVGARIVFVVYVNAPET